MLAQKISKLRYYILASIFAVCLILGGVFLLSSRLLMAQETANAGSDSAAIADLNKQIDEQRAKIDQLATEIAQHQQNIKDAQNKASTLQNQVMIIDNQVAKTNLDIQAKEGEIKTVELEIQAIGLQIKTNETQIEKYKIQLGDFIRTLDRYDQKDYLSVLLSNNSFSEFFDQVKYLENIQGDLQKTLNRVQELVAKLDQQKADLDSKQKNLKNLLDKLEQQKGILSDQKSEKNYLIAQTKQSEKKFQGLISDLKQQQMAANAQIASLERSLRAKLQRNGGAEKFNALGAAVLGWPTDSRRLTTYFHDPDYPYRNLFEHSGIDIGIPTGTPVKAAEAGYVAKVALGTQWYGNYIMIIHSNNLATLYAHLESAAVSADQYVSKGQVIGYSDNTGFSSGPHLHFEVRANGIPVNPLGYLP